MVKSSDIFRKTASSITYSRLEEFRVDPVVHPQSLSDNSHICSNGITDISYLIDETYFCGKKRVVSILDHLCRFPICFYNRNVHAHPSGVYFSDDAKSLTCLCPHDDLVRMSEIIDCFTFCQKFRV